MSDIGGGAADAMAAAEEAMRRKPKSVAEKNLAAYRRYEKQREQARKKKERAERGVIRAALVLTRSRERLRYIEKQMAGLAECLETGQPFRKPRERKPRPGRRIELT